MTSLIFSILLIALISYLFGSLPTGYLLGKRAGIDLRQVGSKSTGATNALRILGKKAGLIVLLTDILKGSFALLVSYFLIKSLSDNLSLLLTKDCSLLELKSFVFLISSLFVILGHSRSVWINFKGGKSVATGAGILLVINWKVALLCILTWLLVIYFSKISSLAAITTVLLLPIYMYLFEFLLLSQEVNNPCQKANAYFYLEIAIFSSLFILYKHKENIRRLIKNQEPKIGKN